MTSIVRSNVPFFKVLQFLMLGLIIFSISADSTFPVIAKQIEDRLGKKGPSKSRENFPICYLDSDYLLCLKDEESVVKRDSPKVESYIVSRADNPQAEIAFGGEAKSPKAQWVKGVQKYKLTGNRTANISLNAGWNLISLPVDPSSYALSAVLQSIEGKFWSVWTYKAGSWKRYIVGASGNTLNTIEPGVGYWINMKTSATLTITGEDTFNTAVQLTRGWNLIGYSSLTEQSRRSALIHIEGLYWSLWTYKNGQWSRYIEGAPGNTLDQMSPGTGYWVNAKDDCLWFLGSSAPVADAGGPYSANVNQQITFDGSGSVDPNDDPLTYAWDFGDGAQGTGVNCAHTYAQGGTFIVTLTVTDNHGLSDADTTQAIIRVPSDVTSPTVAINSPADHSEITSPEDIIGTASDTNLQEYKLEYAPAGGDTFTVFAEGISSVTNGVLGRLDPSLLLNGTYTIRLTATDTNGNTNMVQVHYKVTQDLKVGFFTMSFTDLAVSLPGIDITVTRTYDSRDLEKRDFGICWRMELQNVKAEKNLEEGKEWDQVRQGMTYYLQGLDQHYVTVTLPSGKVEAFAFTPDPSSSPFVPLQATQAKYTPLPGTRSKLEPIGDIDLLVDPGSGELITYDGNTYDPQLYKLTQPNGMVVIISKTEGVKEIIDANGNKVTFAPTSISHSSGKGINIQRDAQGRITRITDPRGNSLRYEYDSQGNLASFINRKGEKTYFRYDSSHRLLEIIGPDGTMSLQNRYGEDGRLSVQIDALGNKTQFQYDMDGKRETVIDRLGNATTYEYDDNGRITRVVDAEGNASTATYDAQGKMTSVTDPLGRTVSFTYDANNFLSTITNPAGETYTLNINSNGQLTSVRDSSGNEEFYTYDPAGNLSSYTDPSGNTINYEWDNSGNPTRIQGPGGQFLQMEYDSFGNMTKRTDHTGKEISVTYDANGNATQTTVSVNGDTLTYGQTFDEEERVVATTNPLGQVTRVEYGQSGKAEAVVDPFNRRTEYEYDALGNVTRITYPDGTSESFEYDAEQQLIAHTDRWGRTKSFVRDSKGRLLQEIFPDGTSTSYTYNEVGQITSWTDQRGNTFENEYDADGRLVTETDPLGGITRNTYDLSGRLISVTDPLNRVTQYEYNDAGLLIKTIFPNGSWATNTYDELGRLSSRTDANGKVTQYEYDPAGNLTKVIDPLGQETTYTYDGLGRRTSITDPAGKTTNFEYDAFGRLLRRILPSGLYDVRAYDPQDRLSSITDFNGNQTTFTYDALHKDLVSKRQYPDGTSVNYTYDGKGKVLTVTDARGTTSYTYDVMDRLSSVQNPDGTVLTYSYDANGNVTSVTTPHGTIQYSYDKLNRVTQVRDVDGQTTSFQYDLAGQLTKVTYPNGLTANYSYNNMGWLTKLENKDANGNIISSYTYETDAVGNRTKVVEHTGRTVEYTYDDLYRLTKERITEPGGSVREITYTYDPAGNRLSKTDSSSGTTLYSYNMDNRMLSAGPYSYTYDNNGNVISRTGPGGTDSFLYDYENRLIRFTPAGGSSTNYTYDVYGNRVGKQGPSGTIQYLIDSNNPTGFSQVLFESDGAGNPLAGYVYAHMPISMNRGGAKRYFHYDGRGSIRLVSNNAGAVTDSFTYDAFGIQLSRTGSTAVLHGFNGEVRDSETGFQYLRSRYYDPVIGRFLTEDSFMGSPYNPQDLNLYTYVQNNPVNAIDPSGHQTLLDISIANSIRNTLLRIQFNVGWSAIQMARGLQLGHTWEQAYHEWLVGQAIDLFFVGVPLLLKGASSAINKLREFGKSVYEKGVANPSFLQMLAEHSYLEHASQFAMKWHKDMMRRMGFGNHDWSKGILFCFMTAKKGLDWLTRWGIKAHNWIEASHHGPARTLAQLREKIFDINFAWMEQLRAPLMKDARKTLTQMRWELSISNMVSQFRGHVSPELAQQLGDGLSRQIAKFCQESLRAAEEFQDILQATNPEVFLHRADWSIEPSYVIFMWQILKGFEAAHPGEEPIR